MTTSDDVVVEFRQVTKTFRRSTGQQLLRSHLASWLGLGSVPKVEFEALRNVSFRLCKSESLAVIGSNGAGKSTLLNLVTGVTIPTRGDVVVNGRIATLLELGAGFHPDLTGRENVLLNASLLGFHRDHMEDLFAKVLSFSGLEAFMDEPLRTYSSGMSMRLAFSVAVHVDPEILIIDEVLGVGDQAFQKRCFEKVLEFRKAGKTILCASHSSEMLQQLCTRAIWLDRGELVLEGEINKVLGAYAGKSNCLGLR